MSSDRERELAIVVAPGRSGTASTFGGETTFMRDDGIIGHLPRIAYQKRPIEEITMRGSPMTHDTPDASSPIDWRRVHALGLPSGSVRALLALAVFGTAWALILMRPGMEIPDYLRDLLFIIMGHYFAARHRASGAPEPGPPPLYLPRGSVRFLLIAGSIAVGVLLFRREQLSSLDRYPGVVTLLLVGGFLLGVAMNAVASWWKDRGHRTPRVVEDLRAIVSLAAAGLLIFLVLNHVLLLVPQGRIDELIPTGLHLGHLGPERILAAVVGFYFGSRS